MSEHVWADDFLPDFGFTAIPLRFATAGAQPVHDWVEYHAGNFVHPSFCVRNIVDINPGAAFFQHKN
jgi:hypothetical protein